MARGELIGQEEPPPPFRSVSGRVRDPGRLGPIVANASLIRPIRRSMSRTHVSRIGVPFVLQHSIYMLYYGDRTEAEP